MPSAAIFEVTRSFNVGELVTLYEIDLTSIGGTIYRFTNNVFEERIPIVFGGDTYTYMPVAMEGIDVSGESGPAQPRFSIATAGGPVNGLIRQHNDLRGAKVTRIRTFAEFLDMRPNGAGGVEVNPGADALAHLPKDIFMVDRKVSANKTMAEFQLVAPTDQEGVRIPLRVVTKRYCDLVYRRWDGVSAFDYTGRHNPCPWGSDVGDGGRYYDRNDQPSAAADDLCSKRIRGCSLRFKEGMQLETSTAKSVTSITRSGSNATATVTAHGWGTGRSVTIAGATQPEYNGTYSITVVSANTFTYTVAGTPVTPATGTITATNVARPHHALPFSGFPGVKGPGEA